MRISDWSSDVCSSDLPEFHTIPISDVERELLQKGYVLNVFDGTESHIEFDAALAEPMLKTLAWGELGPVSLSTIEHSHSMPARAVPLKNEEIGRASCRERVCKYVSISGAAGT